MNNRQAQALHEIICGEERTREKFRNSLISNSPPPKEKPKKMASEPTYAHFPLCQTTQTSQGPRHTHRPTTPARMAAEMMMRADPIHAPKSNEMATVEWTGRDLQGSEIFDEYPVFGGGIGGEVRRYQNYN